MAAQGAVGQKGFIQLAQGAAPRWREAVILGIEDGWLQTLVRTKTADELPAGLSRLTVEGKNFCLIGSPPSRFQVIPGEAEFLALEVEIQELVEKGQSKLHSDSDLHFLSAGESPPRATRKAKAKAGRSSHPPGSSSSSSSSEEGGSADEDLSKTLKLMEKSWLVEGTGGGREDSRKKKSSDSKRHSLLKRSRDKKDKAGTDMQKLVLKSLEQEKDPLKAWMTMQMMKEIGRKKSRSPSRKRGSSIDSNSSASDHQLRRTSAAKAIDNYEASKRRMKRRPLKYVRKYVKAVERELGAEGRPYRISEIGKRINFGKQKTLQRVHYMLAETLELMLAEKWERATSQMVLNLKCVHQTVIDQGDFSVSWMLCQLPDVFSKQRFGGDAEELSHVTAYLKSMTDLEKNAEKIRSSMPWHQHQSAASEDVEKEKKPKKKGKGKGKQHEDEKTEAWEHLPVLEAALGVVPNLIHQPLNCSLAMGHSVDF